MFKTEKYRTNILINLENGIYQFEAYSATGKTYLCKLLKQLAVAGEPVISYTYQDYKLGVDFDNIVKPGEQKLLVIDRYDMFKNTFIDRIKQFSKTGIVLIDCKGDMNIECDFAAIRISPELIEVIP